MSIIEGLGIVVLILAAVVFWIRSRITDGAILINKDEEGKIIFMLDIYIDPYDIVNMKKVSFKVVKDQEIAD